MPFARFKSKELQQQHQQQARNRGETASASCCPPPSAAEDDEEQTVMTLSSSSSSSSSNSLQSLASSSTTRDESEQTLRKRPSFQSLEDALLAEGGVSYHFSSSDGTDTGSALSSSADDKEEEDQVVQLQEEGFATQPLKKVRSASSLQDFSIPKPILEEVTLPDYKTVGVDPDTYLLQLIEAMHGGVKLHPKAALKLNDFFPTITEQQMTRYTMQVVTATRQNQVDVLREIVANQGPDAVDCFNRFGESLLNLACRRGFIDIVDFLIHQVGLSVRTRDDGGRTPLHDACWNAEPLLDICTWLVQQDASLLLVRDKRGYTAFEYARKSDWHIWRKFLYDNRRALLQGLAQKPDIVRIFSCLP
jgi:Ankyrin repeats (3 copies)